MGQSFYPLGTFPGSEGYASAAFGVSADGTFVAGRAGSSGPDEAVRWTADGGLVGLGVLPATRPGSIAYGISGDGSVLVGGVSVGTSGRGFRWTETRGYQTLAGRDASEATSAWAISNDAQWTVGAVGDRSTRQAARWSADGALEILSEVPAGNESYAFGVSGDGSRVVGAGRFEIAPGQPFPTLEAYRWTDGDDRPPTLDRLGWLATPTSGRIFESQALDTSDDGRVVTGYSTSELSTWEAFRWDEDNGMVGLGLLDGGNDSRARAISADGSAIVGVASDRFGDNQAFLWTRAGGMRTVEDVLFEDFGVMIPDGWRLLSAEDISADGRTIVGYAENADGVFEGFVATVPAPATLAPLGLALAALRRRR
jgi:probable HAF family extracellular repeat protein